VTFNIQTRSIARFNVTQNLKKRGWRRKVTMTTTPS